MGIPFYISVERDDELFMDCDIESDKNIDVESDSEL